MRARGVQVTDDIPLKARVRERHGRYKRPRRSPFTTPNSNSYPSSFYTTTYTMNLRTGPGPDLHFKEQYGQLIVDKLDKNFDVSDENTRIIGLPLHKS
jgi:hypothetical protein